MKLKMFFAAVGMVVVGAWAAHGQQGGNQEADLDDALFFKSSPNNCSASAGCSKQQNGDCGNATDQVVCGAVTNTYKFGDGKPSLPPGCYHALDAVGTHFVNNSQANLENYGSGNTGLCNGVGAKCCSSGWGSSQACTDFCNNAGCGSCPGGTSFGVPGVVEE